MRPQKNTAATVFLGIVATILVGWVLYVGASILQPLVIALLLAIMLQPIVRGLARVGIPPVLTVVMLVGMLFFGAIQLGVLLEANLRNLFSAEEPVGRTDPASLDQDEVAEREFNWRALRGHLERRLEESALPPPFTNYVRETLDDLEIQNLAAGLIGGGFGFGRSLLLVLIYMLFIFAEQAIFRRKILSIAGDRQEDAEQVLDTIGQGIQRYLGVKTLVSLVTGALCYAGLVVLNVPYAPVFGVSAFLLNYIPTFGSIIAAIFPVVTVLAYGEPVGKAVAVLAIYLSVNMTLGNYVEPKILGRELDLSPLVIVLSVVVWGTLWGVVGAFLAVPITSAIQIVLASQENTRPLAVLLSSGPPRERWRIRGLAQRRTAHP